MRTTTSRLTLVTGILALCIVSVALAATVNRLPKYNSSGTLVDSGIFEQPSGEVGIGTTNPNAKLQVVSSSINSPWSSGGDLTVIHDRATIPANSQEMFGGLSIGRDKATELAAGDALGGINFGGGPDSGQVRAGYAAIGALRGTVHGTGTLAFYTASTTNVPAERVRITQQGNVGIGTTSPSAKLHIAGDIMVDGNIAAKYQDIAEWVRSSERVSAGTVMVLGSSGTDVVRQSERKYDTSVVGVVSPQPGIALGEKGAGKVLVAHSGRVRVKVDATYGAVEPGDLLVTSPTPGYAMRSTPLTLDGEHIHRPGTVLGKAIGSLNAGKGEVLALLTLQ
ncbi:MAG TPA: hypothetical protein VJM31_14965 [Vicinamibacterales bacterium]|nr:hypothetical protein [Vicinamibacterales bacterium]